MHTHRRDPMRYSKKSAFWKPRGEASEEVQPSDTLFLDSKDPESLGK